MFRSNNGSLLLSRERFPSASSILEGRRSRRNSDDLVEQNNNKKLWGRTRRATRSAGDKETATSSQKETPISLRKKISIRNSLPNRFKLSNNNNNEEDDAKTPLKRISTFQNPFSFSQNPVLIQRRLQTLGTSDLRV